MQMSTDSASDNDLLDRVMDKGIVVEVWDRMGLGGIDLTGARITISLLQLYTKGRNAPFRTGYFWKAERS
jgi:hypothetical protein